MEQIISKGQVISILFTTGTDESFGRAKSELLSVFEEAKGNNRVAAEILKVQPQTLRRWIRKYELGHFINEIRIKFGWTSDVWSKHGGVATSIKRKQN